MTAAEKLRALDGAMRHFDEVAQREARQRYVIALPALADVVEAAQVVRDELDTWEPTERSRANLNNALVALNEVLS